MIIDDVDLIYENYQMINSKFVPTVTNPELFKEICDTKNDEEVAELIKNGQMPAYQDVNKVIKMWTSGWFTPDVMAANSIKSIEDAKKLDRGKILELIEPGMGWNGVPDAMPCEHYSGSGYFSAPWNETLSYKVVCCTLHYKIPLNHLFMDDEDGTDAFDFPSGGSLDGAKDILYDQKIPLSYCFSLYPIEDVEKDEIDDEYGHSNGFSRLIIRDPKTGESDDRPYDDPMYKYQVQKF